MLAELGHESSVVGVARLYARRSPPRWSSTRPTRELADAVEAEGVRCVVAATVMSAPSDRRRAAPRPWSRPEPEEAACRDWRSGASRASARCARATCSPTSSPTPATGGRRHRLRDGDVLVVTQKIVSKAEGRLVAIDPDDPLSHKPLVEEEAVRDRAPPRRPHHHRDEARLRVRQRRRRPLQRRAGLGRAAARSTPTARPGASATACGPASASTVGVIVSDTFGRTWRRGPHRRRHRLRRRRRASSTCAARADALGREHAGHRGGRGRRARRRRPSW